MKDFIIMAVVLVLFGIWLLVYYLKRRNIADGELCDRVSYLTEKDVNQLNGKPKSEQTEKVSAEASTIGKPSAVGSDAKEEKAVPASEVRSQKETAEEFLWKQWVARTGDYRLSKDAIAAAAEALTIEQALVLCNRYQSHHPQLYAGIRRYADWYERSEPAAKIIGLRMEAVMKRGGVVRRP